MSAMPYHLSIDYDETVKGSYRGIDLKQLDGDVRRFATGDPQADWAAYLVFAKTEEIMVLESSSITHFVMDEDQWRFVLDEDGFEILVPETRPGYSAAKDEYAPSP